jgi:biotin carboxyl carrier protein
VKYYADTGRRVYDCAIEVENGETYVVLDGRRYHADLRALTGGDAYSLLLDGKSFEFAVQRRGDAFELSGAAGHFLVRVEDERMRAARERAPRERRRGPRPVAAMMPGVVREVLVAAGERVARGQPLLILEAMKMQNEIRAEEDATIAAVHVRAGEAVEKGATLLDLA